MAFLRTIIDLFTYRDFTQRITNSRMNIQQYSHHKLANKTFCNNF